MTKDTKITLLVSHFACMTFGAMSMVFVTITYMPVQTVFLIGVANAIVVNVVSLLVHAAIRADREGEK